MNVDLHYIPNPVEQLVQLRSLRFSDCKIKYVPSTLKFLANLEELEITNWDRDCEEVVDEIFDLPNIKKLTLTNINLKRICETIGQMQKLEELALNGNLLTSLPESIGKL